MENFFNEFEEYLNAKKLSQSTKKSYLKDINSFFEYLIKNNLSINTVTGNVIDFFIDDLKDKGFSATTVNRMKSTLRCYFRFLNEKGICKNNFVRNIKSEKCDNLNISVLNKSDIVKLLSNVDENSPKGKRDKAILELLYATGIKVSELIELERDDFVINLGIINVKTNGNVRTIPLYGDAFESLKDYCDNARISIIKEEHSRLFTNTNGSAITRQGIWKLIKYYADKSNIKKEISPQIFRHSFAIHLLENGADINYIKEIMGHKDIVSTKIYLKTLKN